MPKACEKTLGDEAHFDWWKVQRTDIAVGTRVFVLRVGAKPTGIVGSGVTTSMPIQRAKRDWIVWAKFDLMLNPDEPHNYPPLDCTQFTTGPLANGEWTLKKSPRASGQIEAPDALYFYWMEHGLKVSGRLPAVLKDDESDLEEAEFPEGRASYRRHLRRERCSNLVKQAKARARREGRLFCWVCTFDFAKRYGKHGEGFIEAHHTVPVNELPESGGETKISDLAMVCSNCHRMLHRRRPWLTMSELGDLLLK